MVDAKPLLILADGENSVLDGKIFSGENQINARMHVGARRIDFADARVRMRRTQELAVRHAWQKNVISEARLPGDLRAAIHTPPRYTDNPQAFIIRPRILRPWRLYRFFLLCHLVSSRSLINDRLQNFNEMPSRYFFTMAASTASKICR